MTFLFKIFKKSFYRSFDKENTGFISEYVFRQIMEGKGDIEENEIQEMLDEYYR